MKDKSFLGIGWKFPVQIDNRGGIGLSVYNQSISESIRMVLNTSKGERVMRPDYGCEINELVFAPNNSNTRSLISYYIEQALLKWETRIILESVEAEPNEFEENRIDINIKYKLREVNTYFNQVYPFYLERGESDTQSQFG